MTSAPGIGPSVRQGLLWSSASNAVLRGATLLVGILVARVISPEEFGVWAVALTVQAVLVTLADVGLSAEIIRTDRLQDRIPTVATLGLLAGGVLTVGTALSSGIIAQALNSPDASPVILVMSFTFLLSGAGVVPFGLLQRTIQQKKLFGVATADFFVATAVTISLILAGFGPMSLAISRVAAQTVATVLLFVMAKTRPKFGFDRAQASPALRFGIPVALANLLSWAILSIDNVAIAGILGATALGYYVLAFNISMWPMTMIGQAIRSVSIAAFSHVSRASPEGKLRTRDPSLGLGVALSWGVAVPAGVLLAALSNPVVEFLYGTKWLEAAPILAALGYFGILRVLFDLMATYLMAHGRSGQVLVVQIVWMLTLVPGVVIAVKTFGAVGAAYAHLVTGALVAAPLYLWLTHTIGANTSQVLKALVTPTLAAVPTWMVAAAAAHWIQTPFLAVLIGGGAGLAIYVACVYRWAKAQRAFGRELDVSLEPMAVEA